MKHQLSGKDDNPKKTGVSGTIGFSAAPHVSRRKRRDSDTESGNETDEGDLPDFEASEESDLEIDGPRLAQWEGEEEGGDDNGSELEVETDRGEGPSKGVVDEGDITSLSYGALLKARRVLEKAHVGSSSDDTDESEDTADSEDDGSVKSLPEKQESKKPGKRPHKHAPIEMSSKRPVTRRRQVVEVKKVNYRDPRFTSLADDSVQQSFQKNYSFLAGIHKNELEMLKADLKRARNMLRSAPRDRRESWEEEIGRLERAYKKAESSVNKDRKDSVERQALEKARKEEKERRKGGKGEWHMKKSAKKELLLKARHDALAESGGRLAVRRAIEKRQKKVSQKEKKRRPPSFADRETQPDRTGPRKKRRVVA